MVLSINYFVLRKIKKGAIEARYYYFILFSNLPCFSSTSTPKNKSAIIKEQNAGLKLELTGHEFKPKPNKVSHELSKAMKPMSERTPGLEKEKADIIKKKQEEKDVERYKECTFVPIRVCAAKSDKYLQKIGRTAKIQPEDFFQYKRFQVSPLKVYS